nr:DNA polymerase zeta catalytic subunit like [Ipomoea batatas]
MDIGADPMRRRQYHGFYSCMSPSCVPVHEEYSRINACQVDAGGRYRRPSSSSWGKIIKKLVNDGKIMCRSKPLTTSFQYDAVSYSQNFDEGRRDDEFPRRHQLCRDLRLNISSMYVVSVFVSGYFENIEDLFPN